MSIRLHSQLDSVEKKRSRLDQENEELRVRLQDLEVAKQVLQQEIDKVGTERGAGGGAPGSAGLFVTAGNKKQEAEGTLLLINSAALCRFSSGFHPIWPLCKFSKLYSDGQFEVTATWKGQLSSRSRRILI